MSSRLTQRRWRPEEYLPEGEPRVAHPRRASDPDEGHARRAGRVLAVFKRRFGFFDPIRQDCRSLVLTRGFLVQLDLRLNTGALLKQHL